MHYAVVINKENRVASLYKFLAGVEIEDRVIKGVCGYFKYASLAFIEDSSDVPLPDDAVVVIFQETTDIYANIYFVNCVHVCGNIKAFETNGEGYYSIMRDHKLKSKFLIHTRAKVLEFRNGAGMEVVLKDLPILAYKDASGYIKKTNRVVEALVTEIMPIDCFSAASEDEAIKIFKEREGL